MSMLGAVVVERAGSSWSLKMARLSRVSPVLNSAPCKLGRHPLHGREGLARAMREGEKACQAVFVWERLRCQCLRFALYLIVLSLIMQIQQGMGKTAEE